MDICVVWNWVIIDAHSNFNLESDMYDRTSTLASLFRIIEILPFGALTDWILSPSSL